MLNEAIKYNNIGWQVVPQVWGTVRPIIKTSEYFHKKDFQEEWFKDKTNIAVVCGKVSNLIVLDIDNINHKFFEELKPLMRGIQTPQSKSNKGYHVFFEYDPGFNIKLQYKDEGVNVFDVQTNRTLITLPPSLHKNGTYNYKWIKDPFNTPIIKMPDSIKDLIKSYTFKEPELIVKDKSKTNNIFVDKLRDIPILDVFSMLGIDLNKEHKANCFMNTHKDTHKSLGVDVAKNYYHCFGCPDNSGDTIKLVQNFYNCGFKEACNTLNRLFFVEFEIKEIEDVEVDKIIENVPEMVRYISKKIKPIDLVREYVINGGVLDKGAVPRKYIPQVIIRSLMSLLFREGMPICKTDQDMTYIYNGAYWMHINKDQVIDLLIRSARGFGVQSFEAIYYDFVERTYKQFNYMNFKEINVNRSVVQISLNNCVIEIDNGLVKKLKFSPDMFFTYKLPYDYDPDADCPRFKSFLDRVMPNNDDQKTAQEFIGYVFTRNSFLKLEKVMLLYGTGSNGKSVFFEIIRSIIGNENITSYSLTDLEEDHYRASLLDKLLNYSPEIGKLRDTDIFKKLASGETISARHKYGHNFLMQDYCRFIFNANQLPTMVEHNIAFFRRFLILHFDQTISEKEKDVQLANKIKNTELSGIFNWILEGLTRILVVKNFTESVKSKELMQKFELETDNVAMFINSEYFVIDEEIEGSVLYIKYKNFCFETGYNKLGRNNFYKRFSNISNYKQILKSKVVCFIKKDEAKEELEEIVNG